MSEVKKINVRHKKFCQEYLKDFNATRAYKVAYNSKNEKAAAVNASKLLRNTKVQEHLSKTLHKTKMQDIMQIDEVLAKLSEIAMGIPREKVFKRKDYNPKKQERELVIDSVTTTQPADEDQLKALELLGRYYKIFLELSNPAIDEAKLRKLNADARVAEARARVMEETGQDVEMLLDKMLDNLAKEDIEHGAE